MSVLDSIFQDGERPILRIGQAARMVGVSQSTLRNYEDLGLVIPCRENGQRLFSMRDVDWLRRLRTYLEERHLGPAAAAWVLRIARLHELRRDRTGDVCSYAATSEGAICWTRGPGAEFAGRTCRTCPAYLEKDGILEFEKRFAVLPR